VTPGSSQPLSLTFGPDGALWYTNTSNQIGRMTTSGAVTNDFTVAGYSTSGDHQTIVTGPDQALWFTDLTGAGSIVRMATDGTAAYEPPGGQAVNGFASTIIVGPDGAFWVSNSLGQMQRIAADGSAVTATYSGAGGPGMVNGPDGAIWIASGNAIKRLTTSGVSTPYFVPTTTPAPFDTGIALGSDGALWFTENGAGQIGRCTTAGVITEYPLPDIPGLTPGSHVLRQPVAIAAGVDGALWFTEQVGNTIGRITTGGSITEYPLPNSVSGPFDIVAGPDNAMWFTEQSGNRIGRIAVK
jgi:virginiamycin B lyase